MKNSKGNVLIIVFVVAALAALGGGYYYYSSQFMLEGPDRQLPEQEEAMEHGSQPINKKFYSNERNGFSFYYPTSVSLTEEGPNEIVLNSSDGKAYIRVYKQYVSECSTTSTKVGVQHISANIEACVSLDIAKAYLVPLPQGGILRITDEANMVDSTELMNMVVDTLRLDPLYEGNANVEKQHVDYDF